MCILCNLKKVIHMNKILVFLGILMIYCFFVFGGCLTSNDTDNVNSIDSDGDGLSDEKELFLGTNISSTDSDKDGVYDFFETDNGTAIDTDGDGIIDTLDADDDGDSILTADEHPNPNGDGNPSDARDSDGDGIPDYLDDDDDGDGIPTVVEIAYSVNLGYDIDEDGILNYLDLDSDGDGVPDSIEGTGDRDGDGIPNFLDINDNDGPLGDLDGDGITNDEEGFSDLIPPDSNDDGIPDYLDPESNENVNSTSPEQTPFLGSWRNIINENEHWTFYTNWTLKYTEVVTDNPPGNPYTAELRFSYTINENVFCLSILIGGHAPPDCYQFEFSNNNQMLTFRNNEEVIVVLIKD